MTSLTQTDSRSTAEVQLAVLLEGVSEKWGMNVLQILGRPASATVEVDGHGTILAPAIVLSQSQVRHLATQIIELLGPEYQGGIQFIVGDLVR
jgi:hypothetical protein